MSTSEKNTIIRINHKQFNVRSFVRWPKVLVRPKTLCGGIRQWRDAYWSIYFMDLNLSGAHPDWHARTAVGGGGGDALPINRLTNFHPSPSVFSHQKMGYNL